MVCFKNDRIPDAQLPAPTLACLSTVPSSKTRPTIIVSIGGSADGFRDTDRRHPAGSGPLWFRAHLSLLKKAS